MSSFCRQGLLPPLPLWRCRGKKIRARQSFIFRDVSEDFTLMRLCFFIIIYFFIFTRYWLKIADSLSTFCSMFLLMPRRGCSDFDNLLLCATQYTTTRPPRQWAPQTNRLRPPTAPPSPTHPLPSSAGGDGGGEWEQTLDLWQVPASVSVTLSLN